MAEEAPGVRLKRYKREEEEKQVHFEVDDEYGPGREVLCSSCITLLAFEGVRLAALRCLAGIGLATPKFCQETAQTWYFLASRALTKLNRTPSLASPLISLGANVAVFHRYEEYVPLKKRRQLEEQERLARLGKVRLTPGTLLCSFVCQCTCAEANNQSKS